MAQDFEEGIDKQRVLSEISGAAPAAPAPQPAPAEAAEAPRPTPPVPPQPAWDPKAARRRNRAASLVVLVVGLIWLTSGLLVKGLAPILIGLVFIGAAIGVWGIAVWDGD